MKMPDATKRKIFEKASFVENLVLECLDSHRFSFKTLEVNFLKKTPSFQKFPAFSRNFFLPDLKKTLEIHHLMWKNKKKLITNDKSAKFCVVFETVLNLTF